MSAPIHEDVTALPAEGALLGLDLGTRTIGVAVSDALRLTATGLETIRRRRLATDLDRLAEIAAGRRAVGVVLGLPRNMDGSEGPRAQSTRAFARNLAARLPLPVALWDERLSTVAVERAMIAADSSRKRRAENVDRLAAAYILDGALARLAVERRAGRAEAPPDP